MSKKEDCPKLLKRSSAGLRWRATLSFGRVLDMPMQHRGEEKLVVGGKKAAAVKQLLSPITKLTTSPPSVLPPLLRNIRKFIPLVIKRDEIGSCWAVNGYLNERFEEQLNRKSCRSRSEERRVGKECR